MDCCITSGQPDLETDQVHKSRTLKKTKVISTDYCAITIEMKINAISKHKIQVENKWAFT